jgi:hypothetical protein
MNGLDVDVAAVLDRTFVGDCGVPHSEPLLRFVDAVIRGDGHGAALARSAVGDVLGDVGVSEAAATIAAFCGLVRVADATGIPLDDGLLADSADLRVASGIDRFAGAANSPSSADVPVDRTDVASFFR